MANDKLKMAKSRTNRRGPKRRGSDALPVAPTVAALVSVVEAFHRERELNLKQPPVPGVKDPLFDQLYKAAARAARELNLVLAATVLGGELKVKGAAR